jgi:hypothetical protein
VHGSGVDVFLGFEVKVEGAFGDMGGRSHVFDTGSGEPFLPEDLDGCGEDFLTAQVGEDLLASGDAGNGRGTHEIKLACFEEMDAGDI